MKRWTRAEQRKVDKYDKQIVNSSNCPYITVNFKINFTDRQLST
jgi:hypothetical protein